MKKVLFMVKRFFTGFKSTFQSEQLDIDFLLAGARKACLVNSENMDSMGGLLHRFFYDVQTVYSHKIKEIPELIDYPQLLITRKGVDTSNVLNEENGLLLIKDLEMGILLGYPPEECMKFHELQERVAVNYHGLTFASEKSRVEEAIRYLDKTFKLPGFMKKGITIQ